MGEDLVTRWGGRIERITTYLSEETLQERIRALGAQISEDYKDKEVVAVAVLKGSIMFYSDLIRNVSIPGLSCDFLGLSSYGSRTKSSASTGRAARGRRKSAANPRPPRVVASYAATSRRGSFGARYRGGSPRPSNARTSPSGSSIKPSQSVAGSQAARRPRR